MTKNTRIAGVILAVLLGCGLVAGITAGAQRPFAEPDDGLTAALSLESTFVGAIAKAEVSVVSIARVKAAPRRQMTRFHDPFGLDLRNPNPRGRLGDPSSPDFIPNEFGTGVIVVPKNNKKERFVLTNYHVVKDGPVAGKARSASDYQLYIHFSDRRSCTASIFAADPRSDLACLKLDLGAAGINPTHLTPIQFSHADQFKKGKLVLVLGNPYAIARDGSASASWGMIGNVSRLPAPVSGLPDDPETLKKETIHHFGTLLQIDTRLNLGTSGGALVNLRGELIGITTSLAALEGYEKSVGFAIPIDRATRRIIGSLTEGHEVEYGFLGIRPNPVRLDKLPRLSGTSKQLFGQFMQASAAEVLRVFPNSPADVSGLRRGDVILGVNGRTIYDHRDLIREVGQLGPGATVRLHVWRGRPRNEFKTLEVKHLGKWPVRDDEGIIATIPRYPPWRGISVDYPTGRQKYLQPTFEYHNAVVVTKIDSHTSSASGKLQVADFVSYVSSPGKKRIPVPTPDRFQAAVNKLKGDVILERVGAGPVTIRE